MRYTKLLHTFKALLMIGIVSTVFHMNSLPAMANSSTHILQAMSTGNITQTNTSVLYDIAPIPASRQPVNTNYYGSPKNPYNELKIATQITKINNYYFIVDCYHNQILYTNNFGCPLTEWNVLTNKVNQPHTIAGDGVVYLVDDTENNRILVFQETNGRFQNTQVFPEIGNRPHYIVYDASTASFYVWSSTTGDMYIMKREPSTNTMYLTQVKHMNELQGIYVRSFTLMGDSIIFPSGNNCNIVVADKNTFEVQVRYPVSPSMSGMAQVYPIGNYFYITVSTNIDGNQSGATLIRTPSLASLYTGQYENIYELFKTKGTPYYISQIGGNYYMTNHRSAKGVWVFQVNNNVVSNVRAMY